MAEPDPAAVRREIAARRRAQVFQMRREGATLDAIAARLGVPRSSVRRMVAREVAALQSDMQPDERRMVHAEALMDIWRVLHGPAAQGDMAAIDRFLRVEERLSRLLGLDRGAPGAERVVPEPAAADESAEDPSPRRRFTRQAAAVNLEEVWGTGADRP